jgi:ABC1 atypical kinase-like domain
MQHYLSIIPKILHWLRIGLGMRRVKTAKKEDRQHAQQALAALLADSRGLAMKIGQVMAGSEDNNPFQTLVTSVTPLPLAKLNRYLNKPLSQALQSLDESFAAASLGQVHHGVLNNGAEVAVKIRYPGIIAAIKAELKISDWLPDGGPVKRWQFDSNDYKSTLRRQLLRETDYRIEMQTQQRFQTQLTVPGLCIPSIYPDYCSDAVLVQSWETGCRFKETSTWSKQQKLEIGRTLLMTLWQSLFVHGEVHGDPHPGCTVLISQQRRLALLKLLDAFHAGNDIDALAGFVAMGFHADKLAYLQDKMPAVCRILFRPFLITRPFHPADWQLSQDLQALLGEQRWWFRAAGPADLMLLLRAFHGVSQQLTQLDIALPWWPLLQHVVGEDLLAQARALQLPTVSGLPTASKPHITAKRLCVRLSENGNTLISMDLPPEAATDLATVIPPSVLSQLATAGEIDVIALSKNLQRDGISPQTLFSLDTGQRQCRVWLE